MAWGLIRVSDMLSSQGVSKYEEYGQPRGYVRVEETVTSQKKQKNLNNELALAQAAFDKEVEVAMGQIHSKGGKLVCIPPKIENNRIIPGKVSLEN